MAKEPVVKGTGVISLALGASFNGPTKRMVCDLHSVSSQLNRARNAMVRFWVRWQEDHPNYIPQQRIDRKGEPKLKKDGSPLIESPAMPQQLDKELYECGRAIAPEVAAKIMSACRSEITDRLLARLPYNHAGKATHRWDGILKFEVQTDCYRGTTIPVPSQDSAFCYMGEASRQLSPGVAQRLKEVGASCAVLRFPLFSDQSGRSETDVVCRVEVRQLSDGNRAVLRRIAAGEWSMRDSELVFDRGKWKLQLVYHQPRGNLGLDPNRTATLVMLAHTDSHPLRIAAEEIKPWMIGHAEMLRAQYERLVIRRKAIQHGYKTDRSTRKGHGRGRVFRSLQPSERAVRDLQDRFVWGMISEVMRYCMRNNCGTLLYREPSLNLRKWSWLDQHGVPFDWTGLLSKLSHKCWTHGIELTTVRMGCAEHREQFGVVKTPAPDRTPEIMQKTGVATAVFIPSNGRRGHQRSPLANGKIKRMAVRRCDDAGASIKERDG